MPKKDKPQKPVIKNAGKVSIAPETEVSKKKAVKDVKPIVTKKVKSKAKVAVVEKRNFMLLDANGNDIGKFTGNNPRQAALKIANSGVETIRIRETGVYKRRNTRDLGKIKEIKVHSFTGKRIQRKRTKKDPKWLPDMINIPKVKKIGIEWITI